MSLAPRWIPVVASLLVVTALAAALASAVRPARAAASGCSRIENSRPGYDLEGFPTCSLPDSNACYNCEYSTSGGYRICAEDIDGTVNCVESETLPRRAQNQTH